MDGKSTDDEYYRKQLNIYSLLVQAYMDKYILESVDYFKINLPKECTDELGNTILVIAHICDLAKTDLALTLWKVFYDNSDDANTIKRLNRYLYNHYGIKYKIKETENEIKFGPLFQKPVMGLLLITS